MPRASTDNPTLWFVGGPPLGGGVFADVQSRLGQGECRSVLDPDHAEDGWRARGEALAGEIAAAGGNVVLIAHGLALPAALVAAPAAAGLVLLNGPVSRLDPVTAAIARLARLSPSLVAASLLRAEVLLPWLASSAGLRRTVANPYVMDRDTVAALAASTVGSGLLRTATASYLASLAVGLPDLSPIGVPTLVLWGDEDRLYPCSEADLLSVRSGGAPYQRLAGGRFLGVVERPWEVAEKVTAFLSKSFPNAPVATLVSQSAPPRPARKRRSG